MKATLSLIAMLGLATFLAACTSAPAMTTTLSITTTETATVTSMTTETSYLTSTVVPTQTTTATLTVTSTFTTIVTADGSPPNTTYRDMALLGEQIYRGFCSRCHSDNFTGTYGYLYLSSYGDAQKLLGEITDMAPDGSPQGQQQRWEILAYLLVQNGYVSGDKTFDPDALSEIPLPRPS